MSNNSRLSVLEIATRLATDIFVDEPSTAKSNAKFAPVVFTADGSPIIDEPMAEVGNDVYELLSDASLGEFYDYCVLITSGWASPIKDGDDNEVAPSQHPERRRVNLLCVASRDGKQASAMRMAGEAELVTDDGKASGPLAYALADLFA